MTPKAIIKLTYFAVDAIDRDSQPLDGMQSHSFLPRLLHVEWMLGDQSVHVRHSLGQIAESSCNVLPIDLTCEHSHENTLGSFLEEAQRRNRRRWCVVGKQLGKTSGKQTIDRDPPRDLSGEAARLSDDRNDVRAELERQRSQAIDKSRSKGETLLISERHESMRHDATHLIVVARAKEPDQSRLDAFV